MTPDKVVVTLIGLGLITFIIWYFWLVKHPGVKAKVGTGGYQEALILVKGGYTPDIIIVDHGKPVRLNFLRTESASCSDTVMFPDFNKSSNLPKGETISIELKPEQPGEYEFQCQMGMFRGKLVVE